MINGTGDPYRILVTGWRFWPRAFSWFVDQMLTVAASWPVDAGRKVIVVDGECPRGGVDLYAHEWTTRELVPRSPGRHRQDRWHPGLYEQGQGSRHPDPGVRLERAAQPGLDYVP